MSTLTTLIGNYDISKIPQPVKDAAIAKVEEYFGLSHEQAAKDLETSAREHPEKDAAWHRTDAIGKTKHRLRGKIGGAVDALWGGVEPIAALLVDDVLAHATVPTPDNGAPTVGASTGGA